MRLLLTVRGGPDERTPVDRDVCVVVESDHNVADLAAALAVQTGVVNGDGRLVVARLGRALDASTRLADCGLRHGDVVALMRSGDPAPEGRAAIGPLVSLDVIAGPEAGRYLLLGTGEFVIGSTTRGPGGVLLHDDGLASSHATLIVAPDASTVIVPGNGDTDVDGVVIHGPTPLSDRSMLRMGRGRFAVRSLANDHAASASSPSSGWAEVAVHRTPYRAIDFRPVELARLGTPPAAREGRRFAIAALLMPLAGGSLFMAGGRTSRLAWIVLALAPFVAVIAWLDDRRSGRRASRRERAAYLARARSIGARAAGARALEREARCDSAPDLASLHRRARTVDQRVWERGLETADALTVRLGLGQVESVTQPEVPTCDDDELLDEICEALNAPALVDDVPILLRLLDSTGVAVWGKADLVEGVVASLVMQLAVLHGPADLMIAACVHPDRSTGSWLPWLPHAQALLGRGLASPVAVDAASGSALVRGLCEIAESQRIVLVVDDRVDFDHSTLALLADAAPRITVIWMGDAANRIPRTSDTVVGVRPTTDGARGAVWTMGFGSGPKDVQVELLSTRSAASMARALSPMRDAAAGRTQLVPRVVALSEVVGTEVLSADGVGKRWALYRAGSLPAHIGFGAGGPVEIDLVESGPHALVAGTSGAGKSELLQTLVASLAANVPPTAVTFLFVDYKGGAFGAAFERLPHSVGLVTNLDQGLANRALVSLRAELTRRMTLLEGRAKDLDELARSGAQTPPRLVILVDEFATLVQEIPDFVAGIVDVAQRGRSLGIHLVLATQRPTGTVNDKILANTNLRIALRLLDPAESTSIVGVPDAAHLPRSARGRAIVRSGHGVAETMQSAWCGGLAPVPGERRPITVSGLTSPASTEPTGSGPSELDLVVEAICEAWGDGLLPRRPWVPALPDLIVADDTWLAVTDDGTGVGALVTVGLRDEPRMQRQRPCVVDFGDTGGLVVVGSGGSGRTSALRQVASSFLDGGDDRRAVVISASRRGYDDVVGWSGCIEVVALDDIERLTRVLAWLAADFERRRSAVATLDPLLVIVDGMGALTQVLDRPDLFAWADVIPAIAGAGRSVGISLAVSNDRRHSLPMAIQSGITARLVLRHSDAEGLIDAGVTPAAARGHELPPGRGWFDGDLVQVAFATCGPRARLSRPVGGRPVERLAARIEVAASDGSDGSSILVGRADLTDRPARVDLRIDHVVVAGPPGSGRTTAIDALARRAAALGYTVVGVHELDRLDSGIEPVIVVIDDADIAPAPADETAIAEVLRTRRARLIVAVDSRTLVGGYLPGWQGETRRWRQQLVLQPTAMELAQLIGPRFAVRPGVSFPPGRGVLITPGGPTLVQVALVKHEGCSGMWGSGHEESLRDPQNPRSQLLRAAD